MMKYLYIVLSFLVITVEASAQLHIGNILKGGSQMRLGNYVFKDGSEYVGELKGRKPHGNGKTTFVNGDVYEGHYVKGKRD